MNAERICGFVNRILYSRLDAPKPTPMFHMELWALCCSDNKQVAIAAPRSHAKSTAVTHAYVLASVLFREKDYVIIVSDTEEQAAEFLGDIKMELKENEELQTLFGVAKIIKDAVTDCVVQMNDGYLFRILAKGAEQKIRGRKWRGKRPNLIVCDDLENDESVENKERRTKFRRWFFSAAKQSLSDHGVIRVVGTILHDDSLLNRLLKNKTWVTKRYAAHAGFDDFSNILWPSKFSEKRLREIRQEFIEENDPDGYSQEYLNDPIVEKAGYFRRDDFVPMEADDHKRRMRYYAGIDFAITKTDRSDYTVIPIVGVDDSGMLYVVDVRRGRWDSLQIVDEMFAAQKAYDPDLFAAESGVIEKAIGPFLRNEMFKRQIFMNLHPMTPTKDKVSRARSLQARMRANGVKFDTDAEWFAPLQEEMVRFPKGTFDDQVDALAWIGLMLDSMVEAQTDEEYEDEMYDEEFGFEPTGRSLVTGY